MEAEEEEESSENGKVEEGSRGSEETGTTL